MATAIIGMIQAGPATPYTPPDPPPDPGETYFVPVSLTFDAPDYAPGDLMTATVTGTAAGDGSLPTVGKSDSAGRVWTVTGQTSTSITLTATA